MDTFHIVMAMKPVEGNFVDTVLMYNSGSLNIDRTRIPVDLEVDASQIRTTTRNARESSDGWGLTLKQGDRPQVVRPDGRFPSNVILDGSEKVVERFPMAKCGGSTTKEYESGNDVFGKRRKVTPCASYEDSGSSARFFYSLEPVQSSEKLEMQSIQLELDI